jgi:hypothetical protein
MVPSGYNYWTMAFVFQSFARYGKGSGPIFRPRAFYPFRLPTVIPSIRYFWNPMNMANRGINERIDMAESEPHELWPVESTNIRKASVTVKVAGLLR